MKVYLLTILACVMVSCTSAQYHLKQDANVKRKIQTQEEVLDKTNVVYIDGVVKALRRIPASEQSDEVKLALRLANNAQALVGLPEPVLALNVDNLLGTGKLKQVEDDKLIKIETKASKALTQKIELQAEAKRIDEKIKDDLYQLDTAHRASIWTKIKLAILGLLVAGVLVVLSIYGGPVLTGIKGLLNIFTRR